MNRTLVALAFAIGVSASPLSAIAEQVAVTHVEYSNDTISQGGKTIVCVVTMVAISPPDPRVLNFQFLIAKNGLGWKITGSLKDWKTMNMVANRVTDGGFTSGSFYHDEDFKKKLTPEGQLIGTLQTLSLFPSFLQAFSSAPYTVRVRWENGHDDVAYYIDQSPDPKIIDTLNACYKTL